MLNKNYGVYMKKVILLLVFCAFAQMSVEARDYTKLHMKEMQHAQKYETTGKYFDRQDVAQVKTDIKDPKIFKVNDFTAVSDSDYAKKIAADNIKYAKIEKDFKSRHTDNFNGQAYGDDFYKVYRIAERMIRANNLQYLNWRIVINRSTDVNAYSHDMNCIEINTGLYDTFLDNDDALAMVIGHEMAHALLGHAQRKKAIRDRIYNITNPDYALLMLSDSILERKLLIESKNMEYAADTEGAILAAKAGYDLDKCADVISFLYTLPQTRDFQSTHPNAKRRLANINDNRKYFIEDEWRDFGRANIYNSDVLNVRVSSDRKSIIIGQGKTQLMNAYYRPETMTQIFERFGYRSYLLGEYSEADKYFKKVLNVDKSNYAVYLYMSYTNEALYKQTGRSSYLKDAKEYAEYALKLKPDSKYSKEQVSAL